MAGFADLLMWVAREGEDRGHLLRPGKTVGGPDGQGGDVPARLSDGGIQ